MGPYRDKKWAESGSLFARMVAARVPAGRANVLDIGAGPKLAPWSMRYVPEDSFLVGIDIDPRVSSNVYLDHTCLAASEALPFDAETFDLVYSDFVFEHLANPTQTIREIWRVLKPGGYFLMRTPNKWHYVTIASRMTPAWAHAWILRFFTPSRSLSDVYPAYYRCNSQRVVIKAFQQQGFAVDEVRMWEGPPGYFSHWKRSLFWLAVAYERVVNSTDLLSGLRGNILASFRRPSTAAEESCACASST